MAFPWCLAVAVTKFGVCHPLAVSCRGSGPLPLLLCPLTSPLLPVQEAAGWRLGAETSQLEFQQAHSAHLDDVALGVSICLRAWAGAQWSRGRIKPSKQAGGTVGQVLADQEWGSELCPQYSPEKSGAPVLSSLFSQCQGDKDKRTQACWPASPTQPTGKDKGQRETLSHKTRWRMIEGHTFS